MAKTKLATELEPQVAENRLHFGGAAGDHQYQVAVLRREKFAQVALLSVAQVLRDRSLPSAIGNLDPREADRVARLQTIRELIQLAPGKLILSWQLDCVDAALFCEHFGEDLESGSREGRRNILEFEAEAHIGLVATEALHRLGIAHADEGRLEIHAEHALVGGGEHSLRHTLNIVGSRTRHFEVDLAELRLAIRAQVLVAEASRDLVVAVKTADHEDLLQDLR